MSRSLTPESSAHPLSYLEDRDLNQDDALPFYSKQNPLLISEHKIPYVKFGFSKNSLANARVAVNGTQHYKISTDVARRSETKITYALTPARVSTISRHHLLPDTVTFANRYDGEKKKVKEWLVKAGSGEGATWTLREEGMTLKFFWDPTTALRLMIEKDGDKEYAGWVEPRTSTSPLTLYIRNGMDNMWDVMLTAVVYIMQKLLRDDEEAVKSQATLRARMKGRPPPI